MESSNDRGAELRPQVIYRAVGWVAGTYKPCPEKFHQGVLVTEDGQTIPANLKRRLRNQLLKKHPVLDTQLDFFKEPYRWSVYPQTDPLRFQLVIRKPLHCASPEEASSGTQSGSSRELDSFRMVGFVESCSGGTVTIRIRRN